MTTFLRCGTNDFLIVKGLEKPVCVKLLDTSHSVPVNANVLTYQLENCCHPVCKGFLKRLRCDSPEDVRDGVVRGCVTIKLPPQILIVLLNAQLTLPPGFIPRHMCHKGD